MKLIIVRRSLGILFVCRCIFYSIYNLLYRMQERYTVIIWIRRTNGFYAHALSSTCTKSSYLLIYFNRFKYRRGFSSLIFSLFFASGEVGLLFRIGYDLPSYWTVFSLLGGGYHRHIMNIDGIITFPDECYPDKQSL